MQSLNSSLAAPSMQGVLASVAVHTGAALFNANSTAGKHGGPHAAAALCIDEIPSCFLQKPPNCDPKVEDCAELITALIFPFFALAIGCVLQPLSKYIKQLPYTLLLLFTGFIIGIIGCKVDLGMLNTSLKQWIHLDPPNLFFYIFLAPLIFEAAFVTQWHIFKRLLIPILTAAFIIVVLQVGLIGAFTMGVVEKGKGWNWWSALMFGAMLSATDPISVTATLKSLGASENLGTMIEGESLVNDGSAFVLWETFFHNAEAAVIQNPEELKPFTVPGIVAFIARSAIGGMALGILFAVVTLVFLTYIYDEFEVETSLTVVVAFLGFWAAQSPAKLSGVICNVASGLVLSAYGRPLISKSVRHPLAEFWELLGWAANTIVFIHAGVLTIAFVWTCENTPLSARDYLLIFAYFLYLQVIRVALFMLFLPILSFKNKWFTWKEDLLVGLSGLRGAVSLILALNVAGAGPIPSHVRSRVFLWTTGVVALSLIVNGLMIPYLLAWLGLDGANKTRADFLSRARATMTQATLTTLDSLCVDLSFKGARWSYVLENVMPLKWLEDDEFGHHYASAAEQLQNNAVSHRLSLEFMSTEHRRASTHADLRLRTSTEMLQSAPDSHQPNRLSLSHAPTNLRAPEYTNNEKMGVAPRPTKAGSIRHSMPPLMSELPDSRAASSLNLAPRWEPSHQRRSVEYDVMRYESAATTQKWSKKIQSELAALHGKQIDANFHEEDDSESDSANDREIRRRMLMNMLTHVRHLSNATLIEYNALVSLEEVIQSAIDANDEHREYDLFVALESKSFFVSILSSNIFSKFIDEKKVSGESVVIASIMYQIMSEILKQPSLQRSRKVEREAKNLYEGASYLLTRLETFNFKAYRWVLSQFAIHTVVAKQDAALSDMLHGGVIDAYEHKVLHRELQNVRRRHSVSPRSIWRKQDKTSNELVAAHPLFGDNLPLFTELTKQPTISLSAGHRLRLENGTLVVVMKGGLQPVGRSSAGNGDALNSTSATSDSGTFGNGAGSQKGNNTFGAGSTHYWAYPSFSGFLGPELVCSINNEQYSDECSVVRERLAESQFIASDVASETVVYTLPSALVRQTATQSKQFRDEVTRFMAREIVLDTLNDQEPHHMRLINEALANSVDEATVLGRAYRILEKLPYMTVVRLHAGEKVGSADNDVLSQTTINGPGVLINGVVRVSVVDTSGLAGATNLLHERLEGPALLPADQLIIQEVADFSSNENGDSSEIQGGDRSSRRTDGLGPVLAHVLIVEHTTIDLTARSRLKRWGADPDTVDMNGRFGMYRQITNDARTDAAAQNAPRSTANISRRSFGDSAPGSPRGDDFV